MVVNNAVERLVVGVGCETAARNARPSGVTPEEYDPQRSEASRDADRILYSPAWRRLAGVTQVITPFEGHATLHNRLTHSEKVAQVSRAIALTLLGDKRLHNTLRKLGGYSADVCYAAGLGHDIGHPPFGHIGEEELDRIARDDLELRDGFEGNAQSLRILTMRRLRSPLYEGLDLTFATLAGIAKYPWVRGTRTPKDDEHKDELKANHEYRRHWSKFNAYDQQADLLQDMRGFLPVNFGAETQTLEASTMDVADDITYALHDLEDFYLAGTLNTAQVHQDLEAVNDKPSDLKPLNPFAKLLDKLRRDYPPQWVSEKHYFAAIESARSLMATTMRAFPRTLTIDDESSVRSRLSHMIGEMIRAVKVQAVPLWSGGPYLGLDQSEWHRIQVLKEITRSYVIQDPDIALLQIGQQTILSELVEMLRQWSKRDEGRLPRALRDELQIARNIHKEPGLRGYGRTQWADRGPEARVYLDFICTLTDAQCISLHEKLSGRRPHHAKVGEGF